MFSKRRYLDLTRSWSFWLSLAALIFGSASCGGGSNSPTEPGDPPISPSNAIGVIGCSQTTNAWRGWNERGDARVWSIVTGYAGGAVTDWSGDIPNGEYWQRLDSNMASNPAPSIVWWQLCDRNRPVGNVMQADQILAEIRRRLPGVTVYVTPLAEFERPETCGKQNIANSRVMTDHLVMTGGAFRGPELPMVLDDWIQPPQGDGGCHVGVDGRTEFGRTLAGFDWQTR